MSVFFSCFLRSFTGILLFWGQVFIVQGQVNNTLTPYALGKYFNLLYKQDQNLVNGVKYYNLHNSATGNPFLISDRSAKGRVVLNGIEYSDILLKYDICNQQVILEYQYSHGGINQVVLNNGFISEFELSDKRFKKYQFAETGEKFFQVLSSGDIILLTEWKKDLVPAGSFSQIAYEYSKEKKKIYLLMNNKLFVIKGNGTFLDMFPGIETGLKKYMKQNQIKIKTAGDSAIMQLLEHCNQLSEKSNTGLQQ